MDSMAESREAFKINPVLSSVELSSVFSHFCILSVLYVSFQSHLRVPSNNIKIFKLLRQVYTKLCCESLSVLRLSQRHLRLKSLQLQLKTTKSKHI